MDSEPAVSKTIVISKITTATTATRTMRITERPLWLKFEDRCGVFFLFFFYIKRKYFSFDQKWTQNKRVTFLSLNTLS